MAGRGFPDRKGVSVTEMLIALVIFTSIMSFTLMAFQTFRGKASENLSKRLVLQMEARKGVVNLYRFLQEGIEVVTPPPGSTMPYLVFKDYVNNLRMVYLEADPGKSKEEERSLFRAMTILKDPLAPTPEEPKPLMTNVVKLNFTTYSRGAVLISAQLRGGKGDFSLVNFVRLQNVSAEDEL